jgi:hypothetical protein
LDFFIHPIGVGMWVVRSRMMRRTILSISGSRVIVASNVAGCV